MCQVKDAAIRDWVKLAVTRARNSGMPAVFWLDSYRPHEAELIKKVKMYLKEHDTSGLDIQIMSQVRAMRYTLERVVRGLDTISVTGNILRDYLTDLFPIMELGTSAKMLSIVPLMAGGGMYETGAGGSAPKHVQQLVEENHLRWDSLGEFLALAVSLEDWASRPATPRPRSWPRTLDAATGKLLDNNKGPSPKTGQLDNRGSQFYLTLYWAQALAAQTDDAELAQALRAAGQGAGRQREEDRRRTAAVQGKPVDIGGYYLADPAKVEAVMRPSEDLRTRIESKHCRHRRHALRRDRRRCQRTGERPGGGQLRARQQEGHVRKRDVGARRRPDSVPSAPRRPASEPMLTECKDGTVSVGGDCKK
jgi:isocitrate dehydrogenase